MPSEAKARRGKRDKLNTKNRLLGLLAILVSERCGISHEKIFKAIDPDWKHPAWKSFLMGERNLPDHRETALTQFLKSTIAKVVAKDPEHPLVRDLCYLRSRAFSEFETEYLELIGKDDQYQLDRELLFALDIERKHQDSKAVQDRAHGFWYVVRYSTLGEKAHLGEIEFCVSLLSVNSNAYTRIKHENGKKEPVVTSLPHFSLRTGRYRTDRARAEHTFRGHIIQSFEPRWILNFVGAPESDSPPLFLMALQLNELRQHATEAYGVITMSNTQTIISGPVAACYIPFPAKLVAMRNSLSKAEFKTNANISKLYREERERLEKNIGRYSKEKLLQVLGPSCGEDVVHHITTYLDQTRQNAGKGEYAGYYAVPIA